jgi:hypothetical protein
MRISSECHGTRCDSGRMHFTIHEVTVLRKGMREAPHDRRIVFLILILVDQLVGRNTGTALGVSDHSRPCEEPHPCIFAIGPHILNRAKNHKTAQLQ